VPPLFAVVFMTVKGTILIYHGTILGYKNRKKTGIYKRIQAELTPIYINGLTQHIVEE
jgi:hypothetical protein